MPVFSKRSKDNLASCHEDLQTLFNEVVQIVDCTVLCGHRGEKEQNEAFNKGFSKLTWPKSKHNSLPSMAADVVPYPIDWFDTKRFRDFGAYVLKVANRLYKEGKITHKVVWGGNWKSFPDMPHYELK